MKLFCTHVRGKQDIKGNFIFGSLKPMTSSLFIMFIYLISWCCRSELIGTLQENPSAEEQLVSAEGSATCCRTAPSRHLSWCGTQAALFLSLPRGNRDHCIILTASQSLLLACVYFNRAVASDWAGYSLHKHRQHLSQRTL